MNKMTLAGFLGGVLLGSAVGLGAQAVSDPGGIHFGWVNTERTASHAGRADSISRDGQLTTYRGHVVLSYSGTQLLIRADQVVLDPKIPRELTLKGDVHVTLEAK